MDGPVRLVPSDIWRQLIAYRDQSQSVFVSLLDYKSWIMVQV
jgi:hypothetical protein